MAAAAFLLFYLREDGREEEGEAGLVVGFYLVANEKLREDMEEDYQETIQGSSNFTGVCHILADFAGKIIFSKVMQGRSENLSSQASIPSLIDHNALRWFISTISEREKAGEFILILGGENSGRNRLFYRDGRYLTPGDLLFALSSAGGHTYLFFR